MGEEKVSFLLDLFEQGFAHAYLSVLEFNGAQHNSYTRIEMVLDNVGRLSLYQTFIDLPDGEQVPSIKVFLHSVHDKNHISCIESKTLINRAANIIYGCKRYCENHPETKINPNSFITKALYKNILLAKKIHNMNNVRKYKSLLLVGLEK